MWKSLLTITCAMLLTLGAAPAAEAGEERDDRARIAVLDFEMRADGARSWWHRQGGAQLQDVFTTELVKTGRFRVIERERLQDILKEHDLSVSGRIDTSTAVELGRLLGVEYLLTGAVTEYGMQQAGGRAPRIGRLPGVRAQRRTFEAAIDARLINTTTGEIMWADSARETEGHADVRVGGVGGGVQRDDRMFDKVMRPCVEQLVQSLRVAEL